MPPRIPPRAIRRPSPPAETSSSTTSNREFFEFRAREETGSGGAGLLLRNRSSGRLRVHEPAPPDQRARLVVRALCVADLPAVLDEVDVRLVALVGREHAEDQVV